MNCSSSAELKSAGGVALKGSDPVVFLGILHLEIPLEMFLKGRDEILYYNMCILTLSSCVSRGFHSLWRHLWIPVVMPSQKRRLVA